jgi:hypothetical protein
MGKVFLKPKKTWMGNKGQSGRLVNAVSTEVSDISLKIYGVITIILQLAEKYPWLNNCCCHWLVLQLLNTTLHSIKNGIWKVLRTAQGFGPQAVQLMRSKKEGT